MLAIAGLLLTVLFTAAAFTNDPPAPLKSPFIGGLTNLYFTPQIPAPELHLDAKLESSRPPAPGACLTRPYAIILIPARPEPDNRSVSKANPASSRMPIIKPDLQAVPIP